MINIKKLIESFPQRLRKNNTSENVSVAFKLSGLESCEFTVIVENGACKILENISELRKCLVEVDSEIYYQIETGELNPQIAFFQGLIKIDNIEEMLKFSKMFDKFEDGILEKNELETKSYPQLSGPLQGVKIMDLSRLLPGPLLTLLLVQLGADVYKIEDPKSLDPVRFCPPFDGKYSLFFEVLNRGKKSIKIPYFSKEGVDEILQKVVDFDVFIEPFRPGVAEKIGLGYDVIKAQNPKIVYVSICGYGIDNEYSAKAGHDLNYLAHSGLLYHLVNAGLRTPPAFQMADIAGGSYIGLSSILAALYSAEKSKKGAHVVVDMTAALAPLGLFPKLENSVEENYPGKRILSGIAPNYNIYECKDGKFIALAALEIKFWKLFCTFFKLNEFENITFQNQQENDRVIQFLQKFFFEKNRDEWVALTKKEDFCLSGIYAPDEVSNPYPLAQDSDSFLNPFRISGHEPNKLWKFKD